MPRHTVTGHTSQFMETMVIHAPSLTMAHMGIMSFMAVVAGVDIIGEKDMNGTDTMTEVKAMVGEADGMSVIKPPRRQQRKSPMV